MRYAITGGAGFIGSHLAKVLLQQGHAVDIIDNLSTGHDYNLADVKDKIKFHMIDIRNNIDMKNILAGMDGIFHHAALTSVSESYQKEREYRDVNVQGTKNVFDAAKETGTKVVFASSSSVYGDSKVIPTPESAEPRPINPYGKTKLDAEVMAQNYGKDIDIVGLRYYNVYGNNSIGPSLGVMSKFYHDIVSNKPLIIEGDGLQKRDFVFVGDVVNATHLAMEKKFGSTFINIGSGTAISIIDLANLFIKSSKKTPSIVYEKGPKGNVSASQADISLAKRLLGWQPQTKLEDWIDSLFKK